MAWRKNMESLRMRAKSFWILFLVHLKGQQTIKNNSLISPTQGSAADAMKIAGAEFMKQIHEAGYHGRVSILNYIHDEILLECEKKLLGWTEKTLKNIMLEVAENMHEGIPAEVEIFHGNSWHDAHPS